MLCSALFWLDLHGTFGQRIATLWLLFGCILMLAMVSFALWRYGPKGAVRRCAIDVQLDWRNFAEAPSDGQLAFAQRWAFWYLILGSVNMLVISLCTTHTHRDP